MKKFIFVAICLAAVSCAFKGGDQSGGNGGKGATSSDLKIDSNFDSDGDGISDLTEIQNGTDPLIADIPALETNFFQNFKIDVFYKKLNNNSPLNLSISTKIKDTDSSFKYKVGKLFAVDNSKYYAAKEGRFSGHSYGVIKDEDFSWVKYPTLDPLMLQSDVIKFRPIIDNIESSFESFETKITLESTVRLVGIRFKEIKNLDLNFYYHDFVKDSYVLLKNVQVNRTFQKGINEQFSVEIENVPLALLKDSYLKHGEFLISEIDNYFIPELDTDYKTLMSKVRAKTVQLLLSTPTEDSIFYVATNNSGISFLEILKRAFIKNYEVENNALKRIGQYENNLGNFEYLIEVKDKDKVGKWFVLTDKFKEHFLDHHYQAGEHITLSYITGNSLASQLLGSQTSYNSKVSTVAYNETLIPLGKISPNSKVEIQLKGLERFGHEAIVTPYSGSFSSSGPNNTALQYSCEWLGIKRSEFNRPFDLTINYNEEWGNLYLVLNEDRFKISTLITEKKVTVRNLDFSFLISIDDISKIKPIKQADENNLSLVMVPTLEKEFQGLKLVSQGGNQQYPWCSFSRPGVLSTFDISSKLYNFEISKNSLDASMIEKEISNAHTWPSNTGASETVKFKLMDDIDYDKNFSLAISSKITNYFN